MLKIGFFLKLAELAASLVTLWNSHRERRAGKAEAILEQRERTDAAAFKAAHARTRRRELDADPDGLRENDGFRRD
jgi:hypothetical protein